jgi:hypothetical protein
LRNEHSEQRQNFVSSPLGGANRGNYVNHRLDLRVGMTGPISHDSETFRLFKVTAALFSYLGLGLVARCDQQVTNADASPLLLTMYARIL